MSIGEAEHAERAPIRCAVLGNAGGGKSTLARRLAERHGVPYVELDRLLWRTGWSAVPAAESDAAIAEVVATEAWIVDGMGRPTAVADRLARATHAVLIDLPPWRHFALAAGRDATWRSGALEHPPAGMGAPPPIERLFEMMWHIETRWMPRIRALVDEAERAGQPTVRITDLDALSAAQDGLRLSRDVAPPFSSRSSTGTGSASPARRART